MIYGVVFLLIMERRCIKNVNEGGLCTAAYFLIQNAATGCSSTCACRCKAKLFTPVITPISTSFSTSAARNTLFSDNIPSKLAYMHRDHISHY